nr:IS30 family transposase [Mycoplasmopsis verecunda]
MSREIKNNSDFWGYSASNAQRKHDLRQRWKQHFILKNEFEKFSDFTDIFVKKFNKKSFGVELTCQYIKNNFNFSQPSLKTVFNWINSNIWIFTTKDLLRKSYKKGGRRKQTAAQALVGVRWVKPFWCRPREINERAEFGHWEIDLIIGRNGNGNCHLLTFHERLTRYGFIVEIDNKNPWKIDLIIWNLIKKYCLNVKSITKDNSIEFKCLFYLAYRLKIYVYQADNYASFQKGGIENFNGLVRRYFPKRTNFNKIS